MLVKNKIRNLISKSYGPGYANACALWKGYGEMGQHPYGWWLRPFGQNARWIGSSWAEVQELWEASREAEGDV